MTIEITGRPNNKTCQGCGRKTIYPEKMFGDWFYPRVQTCFDCIMISCNRFDKIRARRLPKKMNSFWKITFEISDIPRPITLCRKLTQSSKPSSFRVGIFGSVNYY